MIKRLFGALALSTALALFFSIGAYADDFSLTIKTIREVSSFTEEELESVVYYSENFNIKEWGSTTYLIPKNQSLPNGVRIMGARRYFNDWDYEQVQYKTWQDDKAYYFKWKASITSDLQFWSWSKRTTPVQLVITKDNIKSSENFQFGTDYRIIPVTDSLVKFPGSYNLNITSEYTYNKLIFYSMQEVTDFGSLSAYYDSESTLSEFIDSADKLYYSDGDIQLIPDFYTINLEITGIHVYTFKNVPAGEYTISAAFEWSYDGNGLDSSKFLFPNFVYIDDTAGNAQQAFIDILNQVIEEEISPDEALNQLYILDQFMINSSESVSEKIYWISYLDLIQDRIFATEQYRIYLAIKSAIDQISNDLRQIGNNNQTAAATIENSLSVILSYMQSNGSSQTQILSKVTTIAAELSEVDPDDREAADDLAEKIESISGQLSETTPVESALDSRLSDVTLPAFDFDNVREDVEAVGDLAEGLGGIAQTVFGLPKIGWCLILGGVAFYVRKIMKQASK